MYSILSTLLLLHADTTTGYLLPNTPGKYNVTLTTGPLIDYARNDPYAATPTPRALMLSVFQPGKCAFTVPVPYMPGKAAEYQGPFLETTFNISINLSPLFQEARLPVCPDSDHPTSCSPLDKTPILLFSPGYSIPRFYYNHLASAIASSGFTVITINHPHDANILVYPDGHAVYNNASILLSPTWDEYDRAADASFIIDQLSNKTAMASLLPHRGARPFPTDRVAMLGHSVGGASTIIAASRDPRIRAAVNWDGTIFGSPPPPGQAQPVEKMAQPVLFMSHQDFLDPSWEAAWPLLEGPKTVMYVENTTHYTFSDMPTLLEAAGQSAVQFEGLLGTVAPGEMVRILTAYTTAWVGGTLTGGPLLPGEGFPGVSNLIRDNF
jgi:predicted dienelactone hydrolase